MCLYRYIGLRICFPSTDSDHAECYPEFTYGSCHIAVAATDANWRWWWWWWCCCVEEHWSASFRDMESGSAHTVYIIRHLAAWRSVLASAIERQHARCRDERSVNELHRNEVQNLMRMCRCDLQDFKLWGLKPKAGAWFLFLENVGSFVIVASYSGIGAGIGFNVHSTHYRQYF